jgi:hypothetical protein
MITKFKRGGRRNQSIDNYNEHVLSLSSYMPIKVIKMLNDMYFPDYTAVSAEATSRLLGCDRCTLSKILNRHMAMTPRIVITIIDLTGWSMDYFREVSGMPPYVEPMTRKQVEDLCIRTGTVAKSTFRAAA